MRYRHSLRDMTPRKAGSRQLIVDWNWGHGMSRIDRAVSIDDLREVVRRRLPRGIFKFLDRGAEDEHGDVPIGRHMRGAPPVEDCFGA